MPGVTQPGRTRTVLHSLRAYLLCTVGRALLPWLWEFQFSGTISCHQKYTKCRYRAKKRVGLQCSVFGHQDAALGWSFITPVALCASEPNRGRSNHQQFAPVLLAGYLRGSCGNFCYCFFGFVNFQQTPRVEYVLSATYPAADLLSFQCCLHGYGNKQLPRHIVPHVWEKFFFQQTLRSTFYVQNALLGATVAYYPAMDQRLVVVPELFLEHQVRSLCQSMSQACFKVFCLLWLIFL